RDTFTNVDRKGGIAPVPAGNHQLTLIVRINQSHQIAKHNAMLMTQPAPWQNHGRERWVLNMDGQPGFDQLCLTRIQGERSIQAGAQIQSGRAVGGILRKSNLLADTVIQYSYL